MLYYQKKKDRDMNIIIKRVSKCLAFLLIYATISYSYLMAKGFIDKEGSTVLSNSAQAKSQSFSKEITANLVISNDIVRELGKDNAPLTMYIFSSMTCSHCKDYHKYILPKVERDFVSKGNLKVIFVHLPLDVTSMRAAKLGYCLPKNNFYNYISELYGSRDWLFSTSEDALNKYAKRFGLTDEEIKKCDDNKKLTSDILMTRDSAVKDLGVEGTPSFLIVSKDKKELIGPHNYSELKKHLEKLLRNK